MLEKLLYICKQRIQPYSGSDARDLTNNNLPYKR